MKRVQKFNRFVTIILFTGLLSLSSSDVLADESKRNLTAKNEIQEIQKGCAKAVAEPIAREDIAGLRACISNLDNFARSNRSTTFAKTISGDLPLVPVVDWYHEVIYKTDGQFRLDGRLNDEAVEVWLNPSIARTRISRDLAIDLNLQRGFRIRVEENSTEKEYFTTQLGVLQFGPIHISDVVALIDSDLKLDEVALGSNVLQRFELEESSSSLSIRGGIVQEGSEAQLEISRSAIKKILDNLIVSLSALFEERMAKANRILRLATQIDDIDGFGVKRGLLVDVLEEVDQIVEDFPEIYDSKKLQIDVLRKAAQKVKTETIKIIETVARMKALRDEAVNATRLPRKYDLLGDALDELRKLKRMGDSVDPDFINQNLMELQSRLTELEHAMPIEPELVEVAGGCFTMGGIAGDVDAAVDEKQREVCVDRYEIGIYEVTFNEFDRFSNLENERPIDDMGWGRGPKPVINVSYMEATKYAEWLSEQTEQSYRLPTEAEWEFAARGGQESIFPWGNRVGRNRANCMNCESDWGGKETAPVGSFNSNGFGIYDMAGNVAERTCSIYREEFNGSEGLCQPLDAAGDRVVRGGSWKSHARNIRVSYRSAAPEIDKKSRFIGFRLVRSAN